MSRYLFSFILTGFIYITVISLFVYSLNDTPDLLSKQTQSEQRIAFSVISQVKAKVEPEKKKVTREKPQQIIAKKPKKVLKKKEVKKVKKVVKKKKPSKKKTVPKKEITKKTQAVNKKRKEELPTVKNETNQNTSPNIQIKQNLLKEKAKIIAENEKKMLLEKQKNIYFLKIKEIISQNKVYPRIARKRGIEDSVKVKFVISQNGDFLEFKSISCKNIFKKSVQKAIRSSFPFKPQPGLFKENIDLSLTINYRLL